MKVVWSTRFRNSGNMDEDGVVIQVGTNESMSENRTVVSEDIREEHAL